MRSETLLKTLAADTAAGPEIRPYKDAIRAFTDLQDARFADGIDITRLVCGRAQFIDTLLQRIWAHHFAQHPDVCLVAVGGYGRGELHPGSDIDVLILVPRAAENFQQAIEGFVMFLWDIGLEIGHSVRSVSETAEEAAGDLTIMTNLTEPRHIAGDPDLYAAMRDATGPDRIWPTDRFFSAKTQEQEARYAKYDESGYNLEPNLKESPGGLRDIQTVGWVAKRHFGVDNMSDLVSKKFLTESEYKLLRTTEAYLWRIRFALHRLTGRHEDRLLFEHQRNLAKELGFADKNTNLAVEQFMQGYYRQIKIVQRLNEMLLQLFREAILLKNQLGTPEPINRRFQVRNGYLEITNTGIFARYPIAMLEVFLILQQHPEIEGVRASTIRSIRAHRHLIDARFRSDIRAKALFLEIFREHNGLTHAARRMHRYGILARYLPSFSKITGLMQFDLFHVYTVDEHILMVVRNMRRFALDRHADECPRCNMVFKRLAKHELLYLSGLFHDIAKGRGGDHSALGAEDAYAFCIQHGLSEYDATLVSWLVSKHLVMSHVAQRTDIDDPEVIQAFAADVGSPQRLDYLYLLTVADMRGTNPQRWNSWKKALVDSLHEKTERAIRLGLEEAEDEDTLIQVSQAHAKELLMDKGYTEDDINYVWLGLSTDYFLQNTPENVAWHTGLLLDEPRPMAGLQLRMRDDDNRGCSELLIYGPDRDNLFAHTTALLDRLAFNILGARIQATSTGLSINSYFLLEEDGTRPDLRRQAEVGTQIGKRLRGVWQDERQKPVEVKRHFPRRLKSFQMDRSEIRFERDHKRGLTVLQLVTSDRPGLLSKIGAVFAEHDIRVHAARVATAGAIAQDSFSISDHEDRPIHDPAALQALENALRKRLDGTATG